MRVLQCGNCEELKTGIHAAVLGLAAVCGIYNAAAWVSRRQTHLGVNVLLYSALVIWEREHVAHHLMELNKPAKPATLALVENPQSLAA
jgi:hypothetical protein